jgi:hypothetical protein
VSDPERPTRRDDESTWLSEVVDEMHEVPGQAPSKDQFANLLNARPELQPRFDLQPDDEAGADGDEPASGGPSSS